MNSTLRDERDRADTAGVPVEDRDRGACDAPDTEDATTSRHTAPTVAIAYEKRPGRERARRWVVGPAVGAGERGIFEGRPANCKKTGENPRNVELNLLLRGALGLARRAATRRAHRERDLG